MEKNWRPGRFNWLLLAAILFGLAVNYLLWRM